MEIKPSRQEKFLLLVTVQPLRNKGTHKRNKFYYNLSALVSLWLFFLFFVGYTGFGKR